MIYNSINKLLSVGISITYNIYCSEYYAYRYNHNIVNKNTDLWTQKQIECYWDFGSVYDVENNTEVVFDSDFATNYQIKYKTESYNEIESCIRDNEIKSNNEIESYIEEIESYIGEFESNIESIESYIQEIESNIDSIESYIGDKSYTDEIESNIDSIESNLRKIESYIRDNEIESYIGDI
jgi:hypothetical protein